MGFLAGILNDWLCLVAWQAIVKIHTLHVIIRTHHFRFIAHLFREVINFAESHIDSKSESCLNGIKSCVAGTVAAQDKTRADVIELNVRLMEEKDGRENIE